MRGFVFDDDWDFSNWLVRRRIALGFAQDEAAALVGLPLSYFQMVENLPEVVDGDIKQRLIEKLAVRPSELLRRNRDQVLEIIAKRGYIHPRLFGSCARLQDSFDSDIDIIVTQTAAAKPGLTYLIQTEAEIENILSVPVDLVVAPVRPGVKFIKALSEAVSL